MSTIEANKHQNNGWIYLLGADLCVFFFYLRFANDFQLEDVQIIHVSFFFSNNFLFISF